VKLVILTNGGSCFPTLASSVARSGAASATTGSFVFEKNSHDAPPATSTSIAAAAMSHGVFDGWGAGAGAPAARDAGASLDDAGNGIGATTGRASAGGREVAVGIGCGIGGLALAIAGAGAAVGTAPGADESSDAAAGTGAGVTAVCTRFADPASSGVFTLIGVTAFADAGAAAVDALAGVLLGPACAVVDAASIGVFGDGRATPPASAACV
jgi:hypothetical protein